MEGTAGRETRLSAYTLKHKKKQGKREINNEIDRETEGVGILGKKNEKLKKGEINVDTYIINDEFEN